MKRLVSCLLVLLLAVPTALAAQEKTVVDYGDLTELVVAGSQEYEKYDRELRKLKATLYDMQSQHEDLSELGLVMASSIISLNGSIALVKENLAELQGKVDEMKRSLTFPAQCMYLAHYMLSLEAGIAQRKLEALEEELPAYKKKLSLGLITQTVFDDYEKSVKDQRKEVKDAVQETDNNLKELAKYIGVEGAMELDGMPEIDLERIIERDLEADREAYKLYSNAVDEKERAMRSAEITAKFNDTIPNGFDVSAARSDYEKAKTDAYNDFPDVYQELYDAYDDYVTSTIVADAQKEADKMDARYKLGLVSENNKKAVSRMLLEVTDRYEQQRIQLWLKFLEYEFNLS